MPPKRCDLNNLPARSYMNDLKSPADNACAAKALLNLLGCGVGGDIEIFGVLAYQQVPHCAPHHVGVEIVLLQLLNDKQGSRGKIRGLKNR